MDDRSSLPPDGSAEDGISRRRFAAVSGAALLGGLLGVPGRLAASIVGPGVRERSRARAATGTFDLRITISGLCFFVPDQREARMHVLMPRTDGHAHGVDRHLVRLMYDGAHERPDADGLEGRPVAVPLESGALDFAALTDDLDLRLPDAVVNVDPIVRDGIDRDTLGADVAGRVRSRISFGAGRMTTHQAGLRWDLGPYRARQMTYSVDWTIPGIPGTQLDLAVAGLHGRAGRALPPLHPVQGTVELFVLHLMADEFMPYGRARRPPEPGFRAADFAAYYGLFGNPADTPLPRFIGAAGEDWTAVSASYGGAPEREPVLLGGSAYACLVGGSGGPKS